MEHIKSNNEVLSNQFSKALDFIVRELLLII
jgi:hypothetical protein